MQMLLNSVEITFKQCSQFGQAPETWLASFAMAVTLPSLSSPTHFASSQGFIEYYAKG